MIILKHVINRATWGLSELEPLSFTRLIIFEQSLCEWHTEKIVNGVRIFKFEKLGTGLTSFFRTCSRGHWVSEGNENFQMSTVWWWTCTTRSFLYIKHVLNTFCRCFCVPKKVEQVFCFRFYITTLYTLYYFLVVFDSRNQRSSMAFLKKEICIIYYPEFWEAFNNRLWICSSVSFFHI